MKDTQSEEATKQNNDCHARLKILLLDQRDQLVHKNKIIELLKQKYIQHKQGRITDLRKCRLEFALERTALEQTIAKLADENKQLLNRFEALEVAILQANPKALQAPQEFEAEIELASPSQHDDTVVVDFSKERKESRSK